MKFDKKQLEKWIDTELNVLRYYGYREDRKLLIIDSPNIYADVRSIGYCKRSTPLIRRCSPVMITSDKEITENTKIEDLYVVHTWSREDMYTPVEIFMKLYPTRIKDILYILQSEESNPSTTVRI